MTSYDPIFDDIGIGYYQLPKQIIKDPKYYHLSNKSKMLYALMLERMSLSEINHWKDENDQIYIYFTIDHIISELGVSKETAVKCRNELTKYSLLEIKKNGYHKPDRLYIKKIKKTESLKSNCYYRIPRILFRHGQYKKLSIDAKILYSILADRKLLMNSLEQMDMNIKISIRREVAALMSCSKDKAIRIMKELKSSQLIYESEKKKGTTDWLCICLFPSLQFIKEPMYLSDNTCHKADISNFDVDAKPDLHYDELDNDDFELVAKPDLHYDELDNNDFELVAKPDLHYDKLDNNDFELVGKTDFGCGNSCGKKDKVVAKPDLKWSQKPTSYGRKNRPQVVAKTDSNYNLLNISNLDRSTSSSQFTKSMQFGDEKTALYKLNLNKIKQQIDYDHIYGKPFLLNKDSLDEYISVIAEVLCSDKLFYSINGEKVPATIVKETFLKMNSNHVFLAHNSLMKNTTEVYNLKAYLIALFFNSVVFYKTASSVGAL